MSYISEIIVAVVILANYVMFLFGVISIERLVAFAITSIALSMLFITANQEKRK